MVRVMDWNMFWTAFAAVGGTFGTGAGLIALFQTRKANELAQGANRVAEEANGIAADSKRLAEDANRLAGDANQISADANAISQRALRVTADQTVYKWRVEFDAETSSVFLVNDCPHEATDVHVFIRHKDQTLCDRRIDDAPAFGEVEFQDELFMQQIVEDRRSIDRLNSDGFFYAGVGGYRVVVHVAYTTELGSRRSDKIEKRLTDGKRH